MKKAKHLLLLAVVIIICSCSKNQRIVNRLDGSWKVTSMTENGVAVPDSAFAGVIYKFEKCKVKKGACDGSVTEDGKSIPFTYDISDKGTKMTITVFGISETSEITEHTKTKFAWKMVDGSDVTEIAIEKE